VHGTIESVFRVEWRPLAELAPHAAEWRALAARALEPNVFYEPAFALAARPVFGPDAGAGLVWSRTAMPQLLGFFPARIERRRYGIKLPVLVGWTHPYGPLGTPLVDRDASEGVISAWLDHLASQPELPKLLLLPHLPTQGPLAQAIDAAVAQRDGKSAFFAKHQRALLAPDEASADEEAGRSGYLDRAIGRKKRKELRRQRKRLADTGVLMSGGTSEPSGVYRALDDFLALEAGGWKGRAGTAARTDAEIRDFMESAVRHLADEGKAQIDRLHVDGRAIAAIVTLRSGATAWCWKIAYDETFARSSPGVQLLLDSTQALLDDPHIERADSCATAGHPMIDHIWRERLTLADRLVRVGPGGSVTFALACALETARRAAIGGARTLRDLLRRR
jgi:CelD/BcsL family acetyltransferase involved in cellulose biosynthesis